MKFDRDIYFAHVRNHPFDGSFTQQQVDGQNAILDAWEKDPLSNDLRHLAYPLATTAHETGFQMWPIPENGAPTCGGAEYAKEDPQTHQRYYGRGYVQLTWRDNYARATRELGLTGKNDLEKNADRALDPKIASDVMFRGMWEGWFRSGHDLERYFNVDTDDAYGAREIINGDKHIVPDWSDGVSIGNLIASYHDAFLAALEAAATMPAPEPEPVPEPAPVGAVIITVRIDISATPNVNVTIEGESVGS